MQIVNKVDTNYGRQIDILDTDHQLIYFDFAGKSTYMAQLYKYENCFLQQLRKSIINLYAWREFTVNFSNAITLSHVYQAYMYALIEVSDYASTSFFGVSKRKVNPIDIYLSPRNQSKRTKRMADQ
ncbi:hypothetical protein BCV71DRAFT_276189 [Rhizopus microsporus]|uniref:Uncharacterized protein n=1 Tax=Rhizopus microsporus TaxID=58291 RepID=A0A1X0SAX2_RHIZD|nr:hypothetical protein BCV71DRAFT_276189 [Rhizopus microsporus]